MHGRNVLRVIKSRPLLLLESCHISLFMHFNQLCSLIYYNLLFVNIMKNHINLISESPSPYLVHIKSQCPQKKSVVHLMCIIRQVFYEMRFMAGWATELLYPFQQLPLSIHQQRTHLFCVSLTEKKQIIVIKQNNGIFNCIMLFFSFYWSWCNLLCKYVKLYSYVYQCFPLLHLI